jgi:predicted nucleic acid-binding protein
MLVVDTCVLIDIADDDPAFGTRSVASIQEHLSAGLVVSPISYVELAPVFDGSRRLLDQFLDGLGVERSATLDIACRDAAFSAWARYVSERRAGRISRRPVADVFIGAFAARHDGIITRNGGDFRPLFPGLTVIDPTAPE